MRAGEEGIKMDTECVRCGKRWDSDGCHVTSVPGVWREVEYFICSDCKAGAIK